MAGPAKRATSSNTSDPPGPAPGNPAPGAAPDIALTTPLPLPSSLAIPPTPTPTPAAALPAPTLTPEPTLTLSLLPPEGLVRYPSVEDGTCLADSLAVAITWMTGRQDFRISATELLDFWIIIGRRGGASVGRGLEALHHGLGRHRESLCGEDIFDGLFQHRGLSDESFFFLTFSFNRISHPWVASVDG